MKTIDLNDAIKILKYHNEWRRSLKDDMKYTPEEIGVAIDIILDDIKTNHMSYKFTEEEKQALWDWSETPTGKKSILRIIKKYRERTEKDLADMDIKNKKSRQK